MGLDARKPVFVGLIANNKGADQPISVFVLRHLEGVIPILTGERNFPFCS